jgi:cis-zeatin O-glucosyltransferase
MASDEGTEMRRRAAELGGAVHGVVTDGGSSRQDQEELVAYLTR